MKEFFITISLLVLSFGAFAQTADSDSEKKDSTEIVSKNFDMVDSLEVILKNWYYYTGRDTVCYLGENDRDIFDTQTPDSVFKQRIEAISTPMNIVYNSNVQKYLNKYVRNGKYLAPKLLGLSYQYFTMFEEKLDAYNIPLELKYLSVIESALNPKAKSPVGATGLWQFMYKTGLNMGLEINSYVDERMDPEKSTDAACRYLKSLHDTYNDWTLALAAYNAGPGRINGAMRRSGKSTYWEIYPYLPTETRNYVPGYIAMMYMFEYYDKHNFKPTKIDFIEDVDTVMITKDLHFAQLDSVLGIKVEETRELNPQYKLDIVPAKTKPYPLKIQRKYINRFIELEDSIYAFQDSLFFNKTVAPADSNTKSTYYAQQPSGTATITYTVKSGDAIGKIASSYGVSIYDLKGWNRLNSNMIRVGQKLKIYVPESKKSKYSQTTTANENSNSSTKQNQSKAKIDSTYEYYIVQKGDTPQIIASKYSGVSANDIVELNNINPTKLKIGQHLKIRKKL